MTYVGQVVAVLMCLGIKVVGNKGNKKRSREEEQEGGGEKGQER